MFFSLIVYEYLNAFLVPILAIIFCLNLVAIIKKVKKDESTTANTFWLTISFVIMVWIIAFTLLSTLSMH
ncbi:hypothetical protein VQL36_13435 [Chengkuizengella sp. SCS-71B]|uniref:hypothetical protein n=1 Tax=Chengkuizengella sp. SCS-71B TaxID=3115290 RepID=UPI0032C21747